MWRKTYCQKLIIIIKYTIKIFNIKFNIYINTNRVDYIIVDYIIYISYGLI